MNMDIDSQINCKKRLSIDDEEVITILESFNLSVFAYTGDFNAHSFDQKAFQLQKMLALISRFEKMKHLGWVTQTKLTFTKNLISEAHITALSKKAFEFEPYLKTE